MVVTPLHDPFGGHRPYARQLFQLAGVGSVEVDDVVVLTRTAASLARRRFRDAGRYRYRDVDLLAVRYFPSKGSRSRHPCPAPAHRPPPTRPRHVRPDAP